MKELNMEHEFNKSDIENEDGLEIETTTNEDSITTPFNPRNIKIDLKTITIDWLIKRLNQNEINMVTDFQRKGNLWDETKQSRLIESLLIRFPLPIFYFDATDDNNWLIVDGLQRITTFKNFIIDQTLKLQKLEYLDFNDRTFDELPRELQRRIEETQIVTYQIAEGTPTDVKFNLFKRINTGGLMLEPQEIRHALNQGIPAKFIKELADSEEFLQATQNSIKKDRMKDRDLVNRFLAFYNNDYNLYNSDLDSFLNQAMADLNKMTDFEREKIKQNFYKSLSTSFQIFDIYAFRKIIQNQNNSRGPINKALFEITTVTLAKLNDNNILNLINMKNDIKQDYFQLLSDEKFLKSVTSDTGGVQNVKTRFYKFNDFINKYITD
jgi:hypothetical protein